MNNVRVAVIGYGYWGPNLVRNFSNCPLTEVVGVYDANPARRETFSQTAGHIAAARTLDELLELPIDAVAIATPVSTHHALASRCLEAGLHVLIEKPLAATIAQAESLIELASRSDRVLMVDHTFVFSNAVRRIKELIEYGELGELYYIDSVRINLGLFQNDINVIWDLGPHDFSIAGYVLGWQPRSVSAWGCAHVNADIEDVAYVNVDYGDSMLASFHLNWLSPVKVRQMIFAGSRKSLIFNDLNVTEPIKVYDRGIELNESLEERRRILVGYRAGDVWSPHVEPGEALQSMVTHFAECIRSGRAPLTDGRAGLHVVRVLEAATRSIRAQGGRLVLSNGAVLSRPGSPPSAGRRDQHAPPGEGRSSRARPSSSPAGAAAAAAPVSAS